MNSIVAAPKSPLFNWIEGVGLATILQGLPIYANAALMLRLTHHTAASPGYGVLVLIVSASILYALLTLLFRGRRGRTLFKNAYEPAFFDPMLSLADKVAQWRVQPRVSVQLLSTVVMMSLLAVAVVSVGA